ncbi:hypothetical protein PTKIN_Ptkin01aG0002700 [Pterospermum kingtungense]
MKLDSMGVSRDTQLRAFKLLKTVLQEGEGKEIFDFAYQTMKRRWRRLNIVVSMSNGFSLQKIKPQYCTFYNKVREFSPVLEGANIMGRPGNVFGPEDGYGVRTMPKTRSSTLAVRDGSRN